MTYRYPVNGIPGAPLRNQGTRRGQFLSTPELEALRRERSLIGVRVWLSSASTSGKRTREAYMKWRLGTDWPSASTLNRHGGFAALKRMASEANAEGRRAHGTDVPDEVRARAQVIAAEVGATYAAGTVSQPKPVSCADALKTVLAGPHGLATPPKQ